jgi:phage terminase small subunit
MQLRRRKPPAHLGKAGAKLWRELVDEYSVADAAGVALITCAAECLDRMRAAQASIATDGEIVRDRYNAPKLNPACNLEKDARSGFVTALKALNLDLEPLHSGPGRPVSAR